MHWLAQFVAAIVRALLPWVVKQSRPTAEDADPDRKTRDQLQSKVRKHWGATESKHGSNP